MMCARNRDYATARDVAAFSNLGGVEDRVGETGDVPRADEGVQCRAVQGVVRSETLAKLIDLFDEGHGKLQSVRDVGMLARSLRSCHRSERFECSFALLCYSFVDA